MTRLEELFECNIKEFTVAALKEKDEYLPPRWYLGIDDEVKAGDKEFAHQLDAILKEHNKNYAVARTKALKSVEVRRIPSVLFQQWTGEKQPKRRAGESCRALCRHSLSGSGRDFIGQAN
ncbi:MAG: GH3 auxin-responsive promoter family protein [Bacteroidales bacterium]|nr:GH3 auxin-responsive promoter family protein [Bacteroidales bacterium]